MPLFLLLLLMSVPLAQASHPGVWRSERRGITVEAGALPLAAPTFAAPAEVPERSRVVI